MPSKLAILENVDMYTADELVGYIKSGIVTFDELCDDTDGCFPASVRKEVERKIAGSEQEDWANARKSRSIEVLEKYLSTYPDGFHRDEARSLIRSLQEAEVHKASANAWESVDKNSIPELLRVKLWLKELANDEDELTKFSDEERFKASPSLWFQRTEPSQERVVPLS